MIKSRSIFLLTSIALISCSGIGEKTSPIYGKDLERKFYQNPLISSEYVSPAIIQELRDKISFFDNQAFIFSQLYYYLTDLSYKVYSINERNNTIKDSENFLNNAFGSYLLTQTRIYELNLSKEPFNGGLFYLFETQSNYNDFGDSFKYFYDYHLVEFKNDNYYDVFPDDGYFCKVIDAKERKVDCNGVNREWYSTPHLINMINIYNQKIFPLNNFEDEYIEFFYGQFGNNTYKTNLMWKDYIRILPNESFLTSEIVLSGAFRHTNLSYFNSLRLLIRYVYSYLNNNLSRNIFPNFSNPIGVHYDQDNLVFYNNSGGRTCYPSFTQCDEIKYYGTPDLVINFNQKEYYYGNGWSFRENQLSPKETMTPFFSPDNYAFTESEINDLLSFKNEQDFINKIEEIKELNQKSDLQMFKSLLLIGL
jgi:hypothetical protein